MVHRYENQKKKIANKIAKPSDDFEIRCAKLGTYSQDPRRDTSPEDERRVYIHFYEGSSRSGLGMPPCTTAVLPYCTVVSDKHMLGHISFNPECGAR